jgi:hypothetical protein
MDKKKRKNELEIYLNHLKDTKVAKLMARKRELSSKLIDENNFEKFEPLFQELNLINKELTRRLL